MALDYQCGFTTNFAAAAAGGLSLSTSCMYPLDTIKTKMQVEPSLTWRRLLFSKEIVRTLRRGMLVSSVAAAGQGGLRFAVYESIKSRLANKKKSSISFLEIAGCAATGDISSSIIKVPREVITTKLQTNHYKSNRSAEAPGFSYVVKKILAEEGIRELFKGYWTIAARDIPFMVLLLGTYEELKSFHQRAQSSLLNAPPLKQYSFQRGETVTGSPIEPSKITLPTSIGILYGGISGFTAAYITIPFDVIRTRLITHQSHLKHTNIADIFQNILSKEYNLHQNLSKTRIIFNMLFAGAFPRSISWFGLSSIFFPVYESLKVSIGH